MPLLEYGVGDISAANEIIRLLANVFSESEPPAVAVGLSFVDMECFLRQILPRIIPDGLTMVARDKGTGTLAGALLTGDFASPLHLDLTRVSPKFLPIFSLLESLDDRFRDGRKILPGECLHLFMLAVYREYAGLGIAQALARTCLENGASKGYREAVTEATGRISQHVFRKAGFADRFSVLYQDFVHDGKLVFAPIQEHEKAILMGRTL